MHSECEMAIVGLLLVSSLSRPKSNCVPRSGRVQVSRSIIWRLIEIELLLKFYLIINAANKVLEDEGFTQRVVVPVLANVLNSRYGKVYNLFIVYIHKFYY
jgi:hypothetical protein